MVPKTTTPRYDASSMKQHRQEWEEVGRLDPLWGVLSDPTKRYGRWGVDEFLATGQQEVGAVLEAAGRWHLPRYRRHALDVGCGVGRLTRALAAHFDHVTGVDIAASMIAHARRLNADIPRCEFQLLDGRGLPSFRDGSLDFVYSRFVLQHIAQRPLAEAYVQEFVRVVSDEGLIVFQVPAGFPLRRRLQPRPRLYAILRRLRVPDSWLYRRLGLHPIRMYAIPENDVVRLLTDAGAAVLHVERAAIGGSGGEDRTYWATRSS